MFLKQKYIILLIIPLFAFTLHKYYISMTKVEYKKESKTIQITMRIFIDDLQETLNKTYHKDIELALPNESKEIDSLIRNYIPNKFSIKINTYKKTATYLGKEYEDDAVYLYLEVENIENIHSIEIKNSMLTELFSTQKNIIKLIINDKKKTFILTKQKDNDLLEF